MTSTDTALPAGSPLLRPIESHRGRWIAAGVVVVCLAVAGVGVLAKGSSPKPTGAPAGVAGPGVSSLRNVLPATTVQFTELNVGTPKAPSVDRTAALAWLSDSQPETQRVNIGLSQWAGPDVATGVMLVRGRLVPFLAAQVSAENTAAFAARTGNVATALSDGVEMVTPDKGDAGLLGPPLLNSVPASSRIPNGAKTSGVTWTNLDALHSAPAGSDAAALAATLGLTPAQAFPAGDVLAGTATQSGGLLNLDSLAYTLSGKQTSWLAAAALATIPKAVKATGTNEFGQYAAGSPQPVTSLGTGGHNTAPSISAMARLRSLFGTLLQAGQMSVSAPGTSVGTSPSGVVCPAASGSAVICIGGSPLDYFQTTYNEISGAPATGQPASSGLATHDYSDRLLGSAPSASSSSTPPDVAPTTAAVPNQQPSHVVGSILISGPPQASPGAGTPPTGAPSVQGPPPRYQETFGLVETVTTAGLTTTIEF